MNLRLTSLYIAITAKGQNEVTNSTCLAGISTGVGLNVLQFSSPFVEQNVVKFLCHNMDVWSNGTS